MNNFELILDNVDFTDLNEELTESKHLFGILPLRTAYEGSAHREVVDILLRGPLIKEDSSLEELQNAMQCYNYTFMDAFPKLYISILDLMRFVVGEQLGRVIVTKLPPGGKITPHADEGEAAEKYDRFHIVLKGESGDTMICDGEEQEMRTGQVWWFDNNKTHSVENRSDQDRIHVIVDIMIWK